MEPQSGHNRAKKATKRAERVPQGTDMEPKGCQRATKGTKREPNGGEMKNIKKVKNNENINGKQKGFKTLWCFTGYSFGTVFLLYVALVLHWL